MHLRFNEPEIGTLVFTTVGDPGAALAVDELVGLLTPITGSFGRSASTSRGAAAARSDVAARSCALLEEGSCFAGTLAELVLAADQSFMLDVDDGPTARAGRTRTSAGTRWPTDISRLADSVLGPRRRTEGRRGADGRADQGRRRLRLPASSPFAPDDLDWDDEIRIADRRSGASFSPDALTGLEANLRFVGPETMETKIFARLSAWQNWIFTRPNASGTRRRVAPLRHRRASRVRPDTDLNRGFPMAIDYSERIPNNVDLADDRRLQRALEALAAQVLAVVDVSSGPDSYQDRDIYLRTAIDVAQEGWAELRLRAHAGVPVGHLPRRTHESTVASGSATTRGSRSGRTSPASTAPICAG